MSIVTIDDRWGLRGGTAADLATVNEVPLIREGVIETDTGRIKVGNGVDHFSSRKYVNLGAVDFTGLANGYVPAWDAATSTFKMVAQSGGSSGIDRSTKAYEPWDFTKGAPTSSTNTGTNFVTAGNNPVVYVSGTGSATLASGEAGAPGIVRLNTGTTAGSYARLFLTPPTIVLGGGEISYKARLRIPTLSTSSQRFTVIFALADSISGTPKRIGAVLVDNANSGQWTVDAFDSGGSASANTSVAASANTWFNIEWVVNAAASSVELFIAGASAGTVSTHIPTGVALGLCVMLNKNVGAADVALHIDIAEFTQDFTTAR